MDPLVGKQIDKYIVGSRLGSGGMGTVYRCIHVHLEQPRAIKILHGELADDPAFRSRFLKEAKSAAALQHPNIVQTYDFGQESGIYYLVMELVPGGSLRSLCQEHADRGERVPLALGLDLVRQAADGLAAAHRNKTVHRDVKPSNLLLQRLGDDPASDGGLLVKVADFGLARMLEGATTTASGILGTPAYMSPEHCKSGTIDRRSDIYSLGVVLYEVVVGRLPFDAQTPISAALCHLQQPPRPPSDVFPDIPDDLEALILRCLAKKPDDRYGTADELAADLGELVERERRPARRRPRTEMEAASGQERSAAGGRGAAERGPGTSGGKTTEPTRAYRVWATSSTPALVLYLLDLSSSMIQPMGDRRRIDVIQDALTAAIRQMVYRSTKGGRLSPRYRIGIYAYSDDVKDLLGGVKTVDEVAAHGVPELSPMRTTDSACAFAYVADILADEIKRAQDCPAPLVCHMTDGEFTGDDPEPVARDIADLSVRDGSVLIENIFISDRILMRPIRDPTQWSGIMPDTELASPYARKLRSMSSILPESYREMMIEYGFHLASGSVMMLPGNDPQLVSMGFQMSAATPVR